jgi:tRNA(Arg) A34 adenosine deaminase TadA
MRLAIELSRLNVEHGSGGPFGAAIFDAVTGELISVGVNRVVPNSCSFAHAEMMAIGLAQAKRGTYDLGGFGMNPHQLVTSTEPCAMCFGAIPWSGLRGLVCGARDSDARSIGFDEGPKIRDWDKELVRRGIAVQRDVLREEARIALLAYGQRGGEIYNSRESPLDDIATANR